MNPVAPTFTPRSLAIHKSTFAGEMSTNSDHSTTGDETKVSTPQTSYQWSDEVAAQDGDEKIVEDLGSGNGRRGSFVASTIKDSRNLGRQEALTAAIKRALTSRRGEEEQAEGSKLGKPRLEVLRAKKKS